MEKGTVMMIYLHFSYIAWKDRITLQCKQWHFDSSVRLFKASYKELNAPQQFRAMKKVSKHKLFSIWMSGYLLRLKKTMNDSDYERRKRMTLLIVGKCWRPGQQNQQCKKQRGIFQEPISSKLFSILSRSICIWESRLFLTSSFRG